MGLIVLFSVLFLFLAIGVPVAFSIGIAGVAYLLVHARIPLLLIPQVVANGLDSYNVIAIPFFILAAQIMNRAGVTDRLMRFSNTLVGHLKGGLGHVNVLTSMLFAGMSGSAVADSAGLGQVLIPEMKKKGYSPEYSAAITAASSTVGPIIPPSVPIVIYGILAEASIGRLFLAGAIPGLILGGSLLFLNWLLAHRSNFPAGEKAGFRDIVVSFIRAIPALLTPVIMLGGMWAGIFSPTEAAAVAVAYAVIQGVAMRLLTIEKLWVSLKEAAMYSAMIMIVVACASLFGWILTSEQIPARFAHWMLAITENPVIILLIINLFLLIAGCFMEILSVMLMTVPIFIPLITQAGIDPIHFGVIMVLNLMIGLLTPPFGLCLYIAQDIAEVPYSRAVRAVVPFLVIVFFVLMLVTYVPSISLFLPGLMR